MNRLFKCGENCDPVRHLVAESMNQIAIGIAIVMSDGRVLELNRRAREIVAKGDVLLLEKDRLVATHNSNASILAETLARVTGSAARNGCFITLDRSNRRPPLHVYASPLRVNGDRKAPAAALYFSEPDYTFHTNEHLLTILFGLSAAEARVASGIVEGLPVPALAERLHVSVHTVRTQLKSVFAKTGAQRQSDLVRLVTSGLALVSVRE